MTADLWRGQFFMNDLNLTNNTRQRSSVWYHIGAIIAVTAWGASFIFTKVLMDSGFNPVEVYLFRCVIAYLVLLCFNLGQLRAHNFTHELMFLLCGVCGGSIYFITENTSLLYTTSTNVSLITSTSPLITAFLVGLIYRDERPNRGIVIGSVIAFVGVTLVVFNGASAEGDSGIGFNLLGDGLAMLSAVSWSLYALLLRKLNAVYSAIFITRKTFFYGFITALPFLFTEQSHLTWQTLSSVTVWINLLFLGLIASSLAFAMWAVVVGKLGAVKSGNYLYFQPVVTLVIAAIVIHEPITLIGVSGCALTIAGVYLGETLSRKLS